MVPERLKGKKSIYYKQFKSGGYAQITVGELRALMEGYRLGHLKRNEVRLFAARWEHSVRHQDSKTSLYAIVNKGTKQKNNRRLSHRQIDVSAAVLDEWIPQLCEQVVDDYSRRVRPVSRKVLKHIARGCCTTAEALFLFAYFMRRMPQCDTRERLNPHEHFARFRYADFQRWTGIRRETQCRLLPRLMERGFLNTVKTPKYEENGYGQLFVDGFALSLTRLHQQPRRRPKRQASAKKKKSTPPKHLVNAPWKKKSTLIENNPKSDIQEEKRVFERLKMLVEQGDCSKTPLGRLQLKAYQEMSLRRALAA